MDNLKNNTTNIKNQTKIKQEKVKKKEVSQEINLKSLQDEIKKINEEKLRYLAEIDNLRKRFDKEKEDIFKYSITNFANEIILVADNFERVINSISSITEINEKLKPLIDGIQLTFKDLITTLDKFNIKKIDALGKKFDPNFHEAVFEDNKSNKPEGEVIKVIQSGYTIDERLLRPASVAISKGKQVKKN
jgi:molecular chaperone GrpE